MISFDFAFVSEDATEEEVVEERQALVRTAALYGVVDLGFLGTRCWGRAPSRETVVAWLVNTDIGGAVSIEDETIIEYAKLLGWPDIRPLDVHFL